MELRVEIFKDDVNELRFLAESWKKMTNNEFGLDLDVDSFLNTLRWLVRDASVYPTGVLVLRSEKGRPLGFMGLVVIPNPIGKGYMANENYFYVLPEHRSSGGLKLIRAFEKWGSENGCGNVLITASKLANAKHDRVSKLYLRIGYKPFEETFIKGTNHGLS